MIFESKLGSLEPPSTDVFSYLFSTRRTYPADRVLYKVDRQNDTLTSVELERRSRQFAWTLVTRFGITKMDVVAILAKDSVGRISFESSSLYSDEIQILYPIIYLAVLAAGATVELIPVQKDLTANDIAARMEQAEAKLIVTDCTFLTLASVAAASFGNLAIFVPELDKGLFSSNVPEYHDFKITHNSDSEASIAFLNRTSGSTGGKMKTVITTHAHFIATLDATRATLPENTDPDTDTWVSSLSFGFFINSKLHIGLNILLGISVVLMNTSFGPETLDIVERHHVTFLFMPPPTAASFAKYEPQDIDVSSVKWLLSAGAAMPENLQSSTSERLNGVHLDLEWGTSETLLIAIQTRGHASPAGSSGVLVNGVQAKVIEVETGAELEAGDAGEIYIRNTACRFAGYKDNVDANRSTFDADGWFHSGDYGYLDEEGNVYITDRLKELIRVGGGYGVHISATELEATIFSHPAVAQVIVTAIPAPAKGIERPTAFVILKAEWQGRTEVAHADLRAWVQERLTGLRRLTGGFVFLSHFPQIGFKIDRRRLKEMALTAPLAPPASELSTRADVTEIMAGKLAVEPESRLLPVAGVV
ncbi:MAG: hypothetical protein Q9160_008824 [Pyrenula sp. 1 TL-2023]